MRIDQVRFIIFFCCVSLYVVGCAPVREVSSPPPLSFPPPAPPLSGSENRNSREDSPRRMASLHLTEKGKGELEQGELKKAMDRFEKAIGLDSENAAAYYYFAEARFLQKDYRQSLTLLDRAEQLVTGDAGWQVKIYLLQAKNYESAGDRGEAVRRYQKVLTIDPENLEAIKRLK
ncbi:MAG: tetratricopeptide repeat protein [Nitrospirae bacterium]|nr:tetratricopeptide repeat protein [Nitrospirota bacterium]